MTSNQAATTKNANDQEALDRAIAEQSRIEEQGESDFAKDRRESDEAARERDVAAQEEDTARYDKIKADNDAEKLADVEIMQEVWRLRGLGGEDNKAKANELEKTDIHELERL